MLLMNSVLLLMILCGGFHSSHGESLKCEFQDVVHTVVGNLYTCYVRSLDNSYNNVTIDGYTGTHVGYRNDNDVKAIWIHETITRNIPANLGFLSNLTALSIRSSQLVEIKAENFLGMQNLEYLGLVQNKITSLPSDIFSTLTKLKLINLWNNQIQYIESRVFDELTNLNYVDLSNNICVKKVYTTATAVLQMKNDIKFTCDKANDVIQYEIIKELKKELTDLKKELTDLKKELTDLNKELTEAKETIEQKVPKMEQTINKLNMELMEIKSQREMETTTKKQWCYPKFFDTNNDQKPIEKPYF